MHGNIHKLLPSLTTLIHLPLPRDTHTMSDRDTAHPVPSPVFTRTSLFLSLQVYLILLKNFFSDLFFALRNATPPTLRYTLRHPTLLLHPAGWRTLQDVLMGFVWDAYADGVDEGGRDVKEALVRPRARGVVFEIGAGVCYRLLDCLFSTVRADKFKQTIVLYI